MNVEIHRTAVDYPLWTGYLYTMTDDFSHFPLYQAYGHFAAWLFLQQPHQGVSHRLVLREGKEHTKAEEIAWVLAGHVSTDFPKWWRTLRDTGEWEGLL